jgi:hypothetical protein
MSADAIYDACLGIALSIFVVKEPADSEQVRAYAQELAQIAREMVSEDLGRDAALVARAVHYIDQVHAIPPMRGSTDWFWQILSVLLEVARPNAGGVEGEAVKFLDDLRVGLDALKQGSKG